MAKTNLGRVGMVLKGTYDENTPYKKLDVLSHLGSSYVAKKDVFGINPPNEEYWQEIAGIGTMVQDTRNAAEAAISAANSSKAAEASALTAVKNANDAVVNANRAANRVEQMQIDASGLAGDSNKLGGKPPEAYTSVNLLANSYWRIRTNIINQQGQTEYNGSGYTIDRWECGNEAGKTEIVDGGIAFSATGSGSCYFIQDVPSEIAEKLSDTTKAVKLAGGTIYAGTTTTVAIPNGAISFFISSSGKWLYQLEVNPYSTVTLEWVALYEGTYTADTLPPYVPKGYTVELAECRKWYRYIPASTLKTVGEISGGYVYMSIPLDPPMQESPSVSFDSGAQMYVVSTSLDRYLNTQPTEYATKPQRVVIRTAIDSTSREICTCEIGKGGVHLTVS